jgi:putative iron-dependent peroxidase
METGDIVSAVQPGILGSVPDLARYMTFTLEPGADARQVLPALSRLTDGEETVVGLGRSLTLALGGRIAGLRAFPCHQAPAVEVPSTPAALWCWLRGDDRGTLVHRARSIQRAVYPPLRLETVIDAFRYGSGLDLTGYEDGTENPAGEKAIEVGVVHGQGEGLDGSSFVAVQQWVHDLDTFESLTTAAQDHVIGRRRSDNEEIDDAPPSAHVKRAAQESFEPEAFILRRSMPWADEARAGLVFVAFGRSLDAFEALLRRMVGAEDGLPDALFRFTRPVSGAYFWCPPVREGRLELRVLGL